MELGYMLPWLGGTQYISYVVFWDVALYGKSMK